MEHDFQLFDVFNFVALYCDECGTRCGEWFPKIQGYELSTAPRCRSHGGPPSDLLFPNPPLDRKGNPLPSWLLLKRAIKGRKIMREFVRRLMTMPPSKERTEALWEALF